MAKVTFWFEFASTYSYMSAMRIEPLAKAMGVDVRWRPFLLGPIFKAQGLETSPFNVFEAKGRYMWRDMARQAHTLEVPFVKPDPFPQNGLLAARVATLGLEEGWGSDFVRGVYSAHFGEGLPLADETMIAGIVEKLGADGDEAVARAKTDQTVKDALRRATEEAAEIGIFGAPSFTSEDGELFWGNDRLEAALNWAAS